MTQREYGISACSCQEAARHQRAGNDAHRLLRVVGAVPQAECRRRQELHPAEEHCPPGAGWPAGTIQSCATMRRTPR